MRATVCGASAQETGASGWAVDGGSGAFRGAFPKAPEPDAGRTGVSGGWGEARPSGAGTAPEALQTHCASGLGPMLTHVGAFTHREGTLTSPPVTGEDTAVSHEGAGLVSDRSAPGASEDLPMARNSARVLGQ